MRNTVRRLMGVAAIGVLGALVVVPALAAGAQEGGPPPSPGDCTIQSITPNPVDAFPATVTVAGVAPNGVHLTVFLNGTAAGSQDITNGTFSIPVTMTGPANVTANFTFGAQNAYVTGCSSVAGEVVVRPAVVSRPQVAAALAFTGSSNTPSYVLIGVAAVVLGIVLVVAARRRRSQLS